MALTQITNLSSEYIPATGGAHRQVTVAGTAMDWLNFSPSARTKYFVWAVTGGEVRITIDGSDPTASVGYPIAIGATGVWSVQFADSVRAIRTGATSGVFEVMEVDTIGGY